MIGKDHPRLGVGRQAQLPGVDRNRLAGRRPKARLEDVALMAGIDRIHSDWPVHGSRKLRAGLLRRKGLRVGRGRMRRLMGLVGIGAVAPRPRTSVPAGGAARYPCLLRGLAVERPDQVWCLDI